MSSTNKDKKLETYDSRVADNHMFSSQNQNQCLVLIMVLHGKEENDIQHIVASYF